ncbi:MAG: hypothetical protein WC175_03000 [Candidatus Dojkabacteria bacterium]
MVYTNDYNLTKVHVDDWIDIYCDVYQKVVQRMKEYYTEESALAAGVNTTMIAFAKSAGLEIPGIITWDTDGVKLEGFKSFADVKANAGSKFTKSENRYVPAEKSAPSDGFKKKVYDGPKELTGNVTKNQLKYVNKFLDGENGDVARSIAEEFMAQSGVDSPEDLSKQDASSLIDACFKAGGKKGRN